MAPEEDEKEEDEVEAEEEEEEEEMNDDDEGGQDDVVVDEEDPDEEEESEAEAEAELGASKVDRVDQIPHRSLLESELRDASRPPGERGHAPALRQRSRLKRPHAATGSAKAAPAARPAPRLATKYWGRVRENERPVASLRPKLRILNQVEVCDFRLLERPSSPASSGHFLVSWIDRVGGEIQLEARRADLMNCERRRNFTMGIKAVGCNGLESNE